MNLNNFATDMILLFLLYLPANDIKNVRLVCTRLKTIIDAGDFWRLRAQQLLSSVVDTKIFNYCDYIRFLCYNHCFVEESERLFNPMEIVINCIKYNKTKLSYFINYLTTLKRDIRYDHLSDHLLAAGHIDQALQLARIDCGRKFRYLYIKNFDPNQIDQLIKTTELDDYEIELEKEFAAILQNTNISTNNNINGWLDSTDFHIFIIDILDTIVIAKNNFYINMIKDRAKSHANYLNWHTYIKLITLDFDYLKQQQSASFSDFAIENALLFTASLDLFMFLQDFYTFNTEIITRLLIYINSKNKLFNYIFDNYKYMVTRIPIERIMTSKCVYDFNGAIKLLSVFDKNSIDCIRKIPNACPEFRRYCRQLLTK